MVLEATADIAQGEQVLVGYGARYWVRKLYPDRVDEYSRLYAAGPTPTYYETLDQIDPSGSAQAYTAKIQKRSKHAVVETARRHAVYRAARNSVPGRVREVAEAFVDGLKHSQSSSE